MQEMRKLAVFGAGLAMLVVALVGCKTTSSADERSEGRSIDDKNITSHVKEALNREPVYKFEGVTVNTYAGVVQLNGFVNIAEQKRRAQEIAAQQPGVTQVLNGLALKPVMTPTGQPGSSSVYSNPGTTQDADANPNSQPK